MGNLKEIRTRIASVKSTRQITSAMKMVSAAKLKKAQDAVIHLRPYAQKLYDILRSISVSIEADIENIYTDVDEDADVLIVAVSSNKGLCGGFNANINKKLQYMVDHEFAVEFEKKKLSLITIGKHVTRFAKQKEYPLIDSNIDFLDNLSFDIVKPFIENILNLFIEGKYNKIILVYNKFKNAAVQELSVEQFLPVKMEMTDELKNLEADFIFEPNKEIIIDKLIPKTLKIQFYEALLESLAAEHGARMTAMHKATDNANDLLKELQLNYNKARQAAITNEISEIVGGAEALKK